MKVNGTSAKTIAIHFLDRTTDRFTPGMVAKTIIQAKSLLKSGYTEEEIVEVIDHIVDKTDVEMYSLGYVSHAINNILEEINKDKNRAIIKEQLLKAKEEQATSIDTSEVVNVESRERNESKINRFGSQSRERKKPYSDLFE